MGEGERKNEEEENVQKRRRGLWCGINEEMGYKLYRNLIILTKI
jgi:hypothetical protein